MPETVDPIRQVQGIVVSFGEPIIAFQGGAILHKFNWSDGSELESWTARDVHKVWRNRVEGTRRNDLSTDRLQPSLLSDRREPPRDSEGNEITCAHCLYKDRGYFSPVFIRCCMCGQQCHFDCARWQEHVSHFREYCPIYEDGPRTAKARRKP